MTIRYGSVCSGIEAATAAWHPLGWEPAWFSEIEPFPCQVLAHHYPTVPNVGDMTKLLNSEVVRGRTIDLLVGGTPCQSFSVAGLRKGLADPRGNLALVFLAILNALRPRWVVWENVPGVLSSWSDEAPGVDGERWQRNDFDTFTYGLRELGYGLAWRVLDAQYYGVPQRRRRVFVVGYLGDWRPAAAVLFERHSLSGYPPPRRQAGQGTAAGFEVGPGSSRFTDTAPTLDARCKDGPIRNQLGAGVAHSIHAGGNNKCDPERQTYVPDISPAIKARDHKGPSSDGVGDGSPLVAHAFQTSELRQRGTLTPQPVAPTLKAETKRGDTEAIIAIQTGHSQQNGSGLSENVVPTLDQASPSAIAFEPGALKRGTAGSQPNEHTAPTLRSEMGDNQPAVSTVMQVRRLTPRECERLQGFPDDYTLIPVGKKLSADGPRYKALGNSMAVPVMAWIGERIQTVDAFMQKQA